LMPERENFRRELEPRADRGSQRRQESDEQRSHPARERYQSVVRNRNRFNRYGIFSRDRPKVWVIGSENDLPVAALASRRSGKRPREGTSNARGCPRRG